MSTKTRPHGTYAKYVVERCRCDECRAANNAYEKRRCRESAERRWGARPPLFIDATPVRLHLLRLSEAGIGPQQVRMLSGVSHTTQWKLRSRRVTRCTPETARRVLAVHFDDHVFLRSKVDAAPAREIIEELRRMGMTKGAIARALGAKCPALQVARGDRCTLRTLKALRVLRDLVERERFSRVGVA